MKIAKLVSQADQIIELRAALRVIADSCPAYSSESYSPEFESVCEHAYNVLNPPPIAEKPTKVYSKVKGKIMSWEVDTQDPIEAAKTVKEVAGINNPLFVFVQ